MSSDILAHADDPRIILAQPLYTSLNDQQKRRFAQELQGLGHWPEGY